MSKSPPSSPPSRDWRATLFLPKTEFAMKANLPSKEKAMLARWKEMGLYQKLRAQSKGREKSILHDGPPYANGNIHMGTAINKILKDIINRSRQMQGKDAPYVPGWDCHGLPIEWKVEEKYRAKQQDKDDNVLAFRAECRNFAAHWSKEQSQQFQRLGVLGDWDNPYSTMTPAAEAAIMKELHTIVMSGRVYRGLRPVMWSVVEKTALAEAEIEYRDHNSPQVYVGFPVRDGADDLAQARVVIWTTTPWTLPANRAVAFHPELEYGLYDSPQGKFVLGKAREESVAAALGVKLQFLRAVKLGEELKSVSHPLTESGYEDARPLLPAPFVEADSGTGLVHIAPAHGADDFALGQKADLPIAPTLDDEGRYLDSVPRFAGLDVMDERGKMGRANPAVMDALSQAGHLLASERLTHSYPHSWRSKAPVIFRLTPQWFIRVDDELRERALAALDKVHFTPPQSKARLISMIEQRPDWVISRQRLWGVPLGIFVHRESGKILKDEAVNARIQAALAERGADAWFATDPQVFLGEHDASEWEAQQDILDVWFDSGSTHAFVLEDRDELARPADIYLEGSDQHRGWFQSSLLESIASGREAPFRNLITHGFLLNQAGRKMSKSEGQVMDPQKLTEQNGAEILRLWVARTDYTEDMKLGEDALQGTRDAYRKIRNTLRFMLGILHDFTDEERVNLRDKEVYKKLPALEQYVLHTFWLRGDPINELYKKFHLQRATANMIGFMIASLSTYYLDIRKDCLYCDAPSDWKRQASRNVLEEILHCLTVWLAPILCFTAEEAYLLSPREQNEKSVHLQKFPEVSKGWKNYSLRDRWSKLNTLREFIFETLEEERTKKNIGSGLDAAPILYVDDKELCELARENDMAEICITSAVDVRHDPPPANAKILEAPYSYDIDNVPCGLVFQKAEGTKCERCWKILPEVSGSPALCKRCTSVVASLDASRAPTPAL